MAQPVYSTTFIAAAQMGLGAIVYTVPAGRVAVIKTATLTQYIGTTATIMVASVDVTGSGSWVPFHTGTFPISVAPNTSALGTSRFEGSIAIPAGGKVRIQTLSSGNGYGVVAGFLLTP